MTINISNTLCNPSPFKVKFPYEKGIFLEIDPDGHIDLPSKIMEDFIPTQPGYEAVKLEMDQWGIFLRDHTRPYEHQAIEALESYVRTWTRQYQEAINNMKQKAVSQGIYNETAFNESLRQMRYSDLKDRIDKVKSRIELYKDRVTEEKVVHKQFDPERTVLVVDPPKEFASKIAMDVWLAENPEIKRRHESHLKMEANARKAKVTPKPRVVEESEVVEEDGE